MGRIARVVAAKYLHHITQRGNRRQDTFFCEEDELLIHRHEQTGRALGNIHFIKRLGSKLERILVPRKGGRPRKDNN
jgi:putative transposase